MADKFDGIRNAGERFNRKYGVKFDIEEFHGSIEAFDEFGGGADADEMYRITFADLYKKAYLNFFDSKIGNTFDFGAMINDFENDIMTPYREVLKGGGTKPPKPYGGWTVQTYLESVRRHLNGIPEDDVTFIQQRYEKHELRLRDVRATFNAMENNEATTVEDIASLDRYINVIKEINEKRTALDVFCNLFKHFAEKRLLDRYQAYVTEKTGVPYNAEGEVNPVVSARMRLSEGGVTRNAKASVQNALDSFSQEKSAGQDQKHRVNIVDSSNEQPARITERIVTNPVRSDNGREII